MNSLIEAHASNLASALGSPFEVNSSDFNSDYWPSPRKIGATDDNMQWFTILTGEEPSDDFTCLTTKPLGEKALADTDIRLLNGSYTAPLAYPALEWEARWRFADRLNRNTDWPTMEQNVSDYYQNTFEENYSRLNRIYQSYVNRWQPTPEVQELTLAYLWAIEKRFALDSLLSENAEENTDLHEQMISRDANILDKAGMLNTGLETWGADTDQNMLDLLAALHDVSCTQAYESDMKAVLEIMLESHLNGGEMTAPQAAIMSEIAAKCRYSGGYAVVLARSCTGAKEAYDQDKSCDDSGERMQYSGDIAPNGMVLSPNPAAQVVTIALEKPFHQATLAIYNSQGNLVHTRPITAPHTTLPISDYAPGLYRFNIWIDNGLSFSKNLVKTNRKNLAYPL